MFDSIEIAIRDKKLGKLLMVVDVGDGNMRVILYCICSQKCKPGADILWVSMAGALSVLHYTGNGVMNRVMVNGK